MRPPRPVLLASIALTLVAACGGPTVAELQPGELAAARLVDEPERPTPEQWVVTLELDDRSVNGQDLVIVELANAAITCGSGHAADIGGLPAGTAVRVERADRREVDRAHPPLIAGSRLVLDC